MINFKRIYRSDYFARKYKVKVPLILDLEKVLSL